MKFVLANWGTRGEVEPYLTIGRELVRRGHDVRMAVAPEMVDFVESAGPVGVAYGPELKVILEPHRDYWTYWFNNPWKIRKLDRLWREVVEPLTQCRTEVSRTLTSLADGADLLLTGMNYEDTAANVAEYCGIPLATLHHFPWRTNGALVPFVPAPLGRAAMTVYEWLLWRGSKQDEDAQRRELGLPAARGPWTRRIAERGSLEIQAYDAACYPGLAAEWSKWNGQRPFVGALTLELPTDADDDVMSWIASGRPPICFGFGSAAVESAADTFAMIGAACEQLGERALISAAGTDFRSVSHFEHIKVVNAMNFATVLPACRALVHHGGAGTTNAGMRAGLPTLILWTLPDQAIWAARVKRLKLGMGRRFSTTTQESLVSDLRTILAAEYLTQARDFSSRMTRPADSAATTADLIENFALSKRAG
ncbi:glycosyltransferase [Mycobacterium intracellulare]|uniref:Glycosyltransferase n=1 Tax=Mycobacterium intracellulare TaxID=1767 RepID=A0AAE4RIA3_MYCIT|nr:glycosyltransferase [Mycobacterium intracellulare]MCA2323185.1 glycosyltransferase [Mycobacterium intracellulare]MCA2344053.1 glycosyltransferase [Mycobacterium intracellulare]MDV6980183.1 glycosyltransferase [Mycobacterium intracellulare]MDV6985805.1 glycosyltransferase [Mycobacterium intracellulare]MDV7016234.1 glycosyltransferase [Mycobacterium intracellulare]